MPAPRSTSVQGGALRTPLISDRLVGRVSAATNLLIRVDCGDAAQIRSQYLLLPRGVFKDEICRRDDERG